jgi:hypothetical protein
MRKKSSKFLESQIAQYLVNKSFARLESNCEVLSKHLLSRKRVEDILMLAVSQIASAESL